MLYGSLFIYNTITALSFCQCNSFPFARCLYFFISKPGSIPNLTMGYFPEVHRGAITTLPLGEHTDPDIRRAACAATRCMKKERISAQCHQLKEYLLKNNWEKLYGVFFVSLLSSAFSMFLFFHSPISMSRINAAVEIRKKNNIKSYRYTLCAFILFAYIYKQE